MDTSTTVKSVATLTVAAAAAAYYFYPRGSNMPANVISINEAERKKHIEHFPLLPELSGVQRTPSFDHTSSAARLERIHSKSQKGSWKKPQSTGGENGDERKFDEDLLFSPACEELQRSIYAEMDDDFLMKFVDSVRQVHEHALGTDETYQMKIKLRDRLDECSDQLKILQQAKEEVLTRFDASPHGKEIKEYENIKLPKLEQKIDKMNQEHRKKSEQRTSLMSYLERIEKVQGNVESKYTEEALDKSSKLLHKIERLSVYIDQAKDEYAEAMVQLREYIQNCPEYGELRDATKEIERYESDMGITKLRQEIEGKNKFQGNERQVSGGSLEDLVLSLIKHNDFESERLADDNDYQELKRRAPKGELVLLPNFMVRGVTGEIDAMLCYVEETPASHIDNTIPASLLVSQESGVSKNSVHHPSVESTVDLSLSHIAPSPSGTVKKQVAAKHLRPDYRVLAVLKVYEVKKNPNDIAHGFSTKLAMLKFLSGIESNVEYSPKFYPDGCFTESRFSFGGRRYTFTSSSFDVMESAFKKNPELLPLSRFVFYTCARPLIGVASSVKGTLLHRLSSPVSSIRLSNPLEEPNRHRIIKLALSLYTAHVTECNTSDVIEQYVKRGFAHNIRVVLD